MLSARRERLRLHGDLLESLGAYPDGTLIDTNLMNDEIAQTEQRRDEKTQPLTLSVVLLGGAIAFAFVLIATRTTPSPQVNGEKSIIVDLAPLTPQTADVIIEAFGVARAANEASLQAQVAGRIEAVHPNLRIGGIIPAGEPAIRLEKSDFEASVASAEAAVARARAALALEQGTAQSRRTRSGVNGRRLS